LQQLHQLPIEPLAPALPVRHARSTSRSPEVKCRREVDRANPEL
jgi:hypothetical protein